MQVMLLTHRGPLHGLPLTEQEYNSWRKEAGAMVGNYRPVGIYLVTCNPSSYFHLRHIDTCVECICKSSVVVYTCLKDSEHE